MDRPRVLVVEDRPSVLQLAATVLETAYDVTTAGDGATALALIDSAPFDVVLSDVRMPGADGFEVLRAVQRCSPRTPVVVMTAYANVPDAVAAMRRGACDYVAKPLDADEIRLVVARAVALRRGVGEPDHAYPLPQVDFEIEPRGVSLGFHRAIEEARDRASRAYLLELLRAFGGNVTQAAFRAGMTRESLHRVMRKYGIRARGPTSGTDFAGDAGPDKG
jgi:DNA-binding NtrC family response regulator